MNRHTIYVTNQPLAEARQAWQEALEKIGFFRRRPQETIRVEQALGRLTAAPVFALHSSPSYPAAAMDGIALFFGDLSTASESNPVILGPDRFLRVNTGNAIADRFNAVVMNEDIHWLEDGRVELTSPAPPWQHVRTVGEDIVATELIIPEGQAIRPIDIGAMLAAGVVEVAVRRPPRVVIIPTGSELIDPGQPAQPGQIIEFNSRVLSGYLTEWGAHAEVHPPVPDDPELLLKALRAAVERADVVVTNAGASAGSKDFSNHVIGSLGSVIVHGVAIKPGKPVILATAGQTPVIGLPGYPISALLTLRLFVRDMIYGFLGSQTPAPRLTKAIMSRPMPSPMGVDEFVRVTLGRVGDNLIATPSGKGAGSVMSMVRADGLITIGAGSEGIGAGERVQVELLRRRSEVDATLVMIGSHDNILDLLANHLHRLHPPIRLSSAHVGSMGGIMAIKRGEAHLAGSHLLDEQTGEYNISFIKRFLPNLPLRLFNLCYRQQGLLVAKGNPKQIGSLADIAERGLRFINRQKGAGTRLLTDSMLRATGLDVERLNGYNHEEYTHMNIAAAVASGSADAGMGIRAAAVALDVDFVPLVEERYDLIVPESFVHDPRVCAALELITADAEFRNKIIGLGGYSLRDAGTIMYQQ